MKNKDFVSEITNDLRALNIDDRISPRYILSKGRGYAEVYIKRENDQRKLYDYDDIWLTVPCIAMEPSNNIECCGISIPKCKTWMKSKKKIPELYLTGQGPAVKELQSLRGDLTFNKTTPRDYEKIMKRRYQNKDFKYFWFENDYLVIPDVEVEFVTLVAFFKDKKQGKLLSECPEKVCGVDDTLCSFPMDESFPCPGYLMAQVKLDTITNLATFYKRMIIDEIPDLNTNRKTNAK